MSMEVFSKILSPPWEISRKCKMAICLRGCQNKISALVGEWKHWSLSSLLHWEFTEQNQGWNVTKSALCPCLLPFFKCISHQVLRRLQKSCLASSISLPGLWLLSLHWSQWGPTRTSTPRASQAKSRGSASPGWSPWSPFTSHHPLPPPQVGVSPWELDRPTLVSTGKQESWESHIKSFQWSVEGCLSFLRGLPCTPGR